MAGWRERQAKKLESKPAVEVNDITFPPLTTENGWTDDAKTKKPVLKKSFASLARDWNESAEIEKQRAALEEERRRMDEAERERIRKLHRYNIGTWHARDEDTYYDDGHQIAYYDDGTEYEYPGDTQTDDTVNDWETVSKKVRKPARNVMFEEPVQEEQETVWNTSDDQE